jgi:hypothetical protein
MEMNMTNTFTGPSRQRGISTLAITMLLLLILSVVVLFSTSVGFFEQRTALNENRARIAEQAAETGINMAGEYIKANRALIISNATGGWLDTTTTGYRWVSCNGIGNNVTIGNPARPHPCRAEPNITRRNELWFFTQDGSDTYLPYGEIPNVGGTAAFESEVNVEVLLCRIDTSLPTPACTKNPASGNRIAVTFISRAELTEEGGVAVIKETWASYTDANATASVPIIGSGIVKGLGNAQIVTNPNAGGYGVPASMWSPNDIGVGSGPSVAPDCPAPGGVGSVSTCQVGEYLKSTPPSELKTTCADVNNACNCPSITASENNFLSGHSNSGVKKEGIDILDVDNGDGLLPDVGYFPGVNCNDVPLDDIGDDTDDSLFEFVFNIGNVVNRGSVNTNTDCAGGNCAAFHLTDTLGATVLANCNTLGPASSGLYYITGNCDFPNGKIGSPSSPVVIVVEEEARINNNIIYGMVFVRSDDQSAVFNGNGNAKIFGSLVVEGDIDLTGTIDIVYDNAAINSDPFTLPSNAKFARVPGSWLDATEGF